MASTNPPSLFEETKRETKQCNVNELKLKADEFTTPLAGSPQRRAFVPNAAALGQTSFDDVSGEHLVTWILVPSVKPRSNPKPELQAAAHSIV